MDYTIHICRVPEFMSSRLDWVPHPPPPQVSVSPRSGDTTHSLEGKGVGGPNSDDWTETLVLYIENWWHRLPKGTVSSLDGGVDHTWLPARLGGGGCSRTRQ
jgi:hypothetical protein